LWDDRIKQNMKQIIPLLFSSGQDAVGKRKVRACVFAKVWMERCFHECLVVVDSGLCVLRALISVHCFSCGCVYFSSMFYLFVCVSLANCVREEFVRVIRTRFHGRFELQRVGDRDQLLSRPVSNYVDNAAVGTGHAARSRKRHVSQREDFEMNSTFELIPLLLVFLSVTVCSSLHSCDDPCSLFGNMF